MYNIPVCMAYLQIGDSWAVEDPNEAFCNFTGYDLNELKTMEDAKNLFFETDIGLAMNTANYIYHNKCQMSHEIRIMKKNGELAWCLIKFAYETGAGQLPQVFVALWDIAEYKREQHQMLITNQMYKLMDQIGDDMPIDILLNDETALYSGKYKRIRKIEPVYDQYVPLDEMIANIHSSDRESFLAVVERARNSKIELSGKVECRFLISAPKDAPKYRWFRLFYKFIMGSDNEVYRIVGRCYNIDKDVKLREEVKLDPLTRLLNKVEIAEEVSYVLENEADKKHAVFLIDIDNFKGINDTFGHTFGDTVISDVAKNITGIFRTSDLVGRVGGDEFLVLMKNVTVDKVADKAQQLCRLMRKQYTGGDTVRNISTSVGIAMFDNDGQTYEELFAKADSAMYKAKTSGKNKYSFSDETDEAPLRKTKKENDNREYLDVENRQFFTYAVNLLTHARNIDASLNLLLEQMRQRYHLDMIILMVLKQSTGNLEITNYSAEGVDFPPNTSFGSFDMDDIKCELGRMYVADIDTIRQWGMVAMARGTSISEQYMEHVSMIYGVIESVLGKNGMVSCFSFDVDRVWDDNTTAAIGELCRIISVFVSLKNRISEGEAQLKHFQHRDALTGLYNLEYFKRRFPKELHSNFKDNTLALMYLDINNFGYVNENYGHVQGDRLLKLLSQNFMDYEGFIMGARLYSDFFIIMLKDQSKSDIVERMLKSMKSFRRIYDSQYPNGSLGMSIGLYFIEDEREDVETALENANLAWKVTKNSGNRKITVYREEMRIRRGHEQSIIGEFYKALYRGDMVPYLQPKFELDTGRVYGAEALVRWIKEDGTVVPPGEFIPILEKIGYITELDFYIYEEVLKIMSRWIEEKHRKIVVSINFSGRHFDNKETEFINRINAITAKYKIPNWWIEIEITESVVARNYELMENSLRQLQREGYRVAIDDFGTGYSSLSVLTDIPADVIKIDKSFIDKEQDDRNISVLKGIGDLIKNCGRDAICEGVETNEQREELIRSGYSHGQGYLCNRPIPADEFEKLYFAEEEGKD